MPGGDHIIGVDADVAQLTEEHGDLGIDVKKCTNWHDYMMTTWTKFSQQTKFEIKNFSCSIRKPVIPETDKVNFDADRCDGVVYFTVDQSFLYAAFCEFLICHQCHNYFQLLK